MLRIRLTRTGKKGQPSYRIVVAEHTAPIKSKFIEVVGHYNLAVNPRILEVDQERVKYWISVGAKPTDRVATLLKGEGMENMDQYIGRRDLQRKKKKSSAEEDGGDGGGSAAVTEEKGNEEGGDEAAAEEKPAEDKPADEDKKEEAAAEEKAEEPKEEAKEEEKPAEEPKEEPKEEEAPAEEEKTDSDN